MPVVSMFFKQTKEQQVKPETLEEHQDGYSHTVEKKAVIAMVTPLMLTCITGLILGCEPDAGPKLYQMAQMAAESVTGEGGVYLAE